MDFAQELRSRHQGLWDAILRHPFIHQLARGELPREKFIYYVEQDLLYLVEFTRCTNLAASKAEDLEGIQRWTRLAMGCINYETALLEDLSQRLGINRDLTWEKSPTTLAYTNHLLRVATMGVLGEIAAALLPCMWTYLDVGEIVVDAGCPDPLYREWGEAYTTPEYRELVGFYIDSVNREAAKLGSRHRALMEDHFHTSLQYECLFWDMAEGMESWGPTCG